MKKVALSSVIPIFYWYQIYDKILRMTVWSTAAMMRPINALFFQFSRMHRQCGVIFRGFFSSLLTMQLGCNYWKRRLDYSWVRQSIICVKIAIQSLILNSNIQVYQISLFCRIFRMQESTKPTMEYRFLGPTGIKVSVISYGNWVNSNTEEAKQVTIDCVKKAWDLGINFFDTAEVYGWGQAEIQLGEALRRLNVPRHHLVVSTKIYYANKDRIPNSNGLSRKHVIEGMKNSLKRLGLEYVDVVFCHRPDYETPLQETCRAFDWLIRRGYVYYWGTSEWTAQDIAEAHFICQKYNLIKPVVEQPEYNLLNREKIEFGFRHLFEDKKLGTTVWSPLGSGVLTGKYNNGIPEDSRFSKNPDLKRIFDRYLGDATKEKTLKALNQFGEIAKELNCSMAQLAMAWVINNPDVSTAITGASKIEQLEDTVQAIQVRKKLTPEIERRIEKSFQTAPKGKLDMPKGTVHKSRRFKLLGYGDSEVTQTK